MADGTCGIYRWRSHAALDWPGCPSIRVGDVHPYAEPHRADREKPAASYKLVPPNRLCLASWHLADPRFFRSTLPAAASTKNEKNLASILKTTIEMPQTLLTASMRMLGGHARAAAAAGDALSVPYFTAAGPDDGRTHELHPGISSRAGALCVSNFTSGNRRCTHGSVSGRSTNGSLGASDGSATESFYLRSRVSVEMGSGHKCAPARFRG